MTQICSYVFRYSGNWKTNLEDVPKHNAFFFCFFSHKSIQKKTHTNTMCTLYVYARNAGFWNTCIWNTIWNYEFRDVYRRFLTSSCSWCMTVTVTIKFENNNRGDKFAHGLLIEHFLLNPPYWTITAFFVNFRSSLN